MSRSESPPGPGTGETGTIDRTASALRGLPIQLSKYRAETITNRQFSQWDLSGLEAFYLPDALVGLMPAPPLATQEFIEDDNRGAILPEAVATLDGLPFYLSVKGIGSTIDPYSWKALDRTYAAELSGDDMLRRRLGQASGHTTDRVITGELWLRGSPYGGQGLEHASTALAVSERADVTSIGGFRIAPVVKIAYLPLALESEIRKIYWYRKFHGRLVQELRLVPSNVRVFFHSRNALGTSVGQVFDLFRIDAPWKAHGFAVNFLRSGVAMLTLFSRSLRYDPGRGRYRGLDFYDVWMDKDAVVAPDGTLFFVDLEGIQEVAVEENEIREKVEDQVYRSLYELMFAYSQVEEERLRRFGGAGTRRHRLEALLEEALQQDPFVTLRRSGRTLEMVIRNECEGGPLYVPFGMVDS